MKTIKDLKIQLYADGADKESLIRFYRDERISGLTTNPTLMRKAGIEDFEGFARDVLEVVKTKPISFEVFSDDFAQMKREALKIASWQDNIFVKIPITNTQGESSVPLIGELIKEGVQVNVTAMLSTSQVESVAGVLDEKVAALLSLFAGRIADTGRDPVPHIDKALDIIRGFPKAQLLWASVREVLNLYQADEVGCHIVTVPHALLEKALKLSGMDLETLSLETVQMFHNDAMSAGYKIDC